MSYYKQFENQQTFKSFNNFQKMYNTGLLSEEEAIKILDKIDNLISNSILYAERRCCKIKSEKFHTLLK